MLAAAAAAISLAISGCGSSSVSNALDPVAQAASASTSTAGYRMNLSMQMTSPALPGGITASGTGSFDVRDHAGAFNLRMTLPDVPQLTQVLGSNGLSIQEILSGMVVYVRMPQALASKLPAGKPWVKIDVAKQAASMGMPGLQSLTSSPFSSDPSQLLQYLRSVSGGVTKVGTATVAGFHTTEYKGTVDLSKVADKVPTTNRAAIRQTIQQMENLTHVKSLPVEVWIDNSHLVRKMALQMNITEPTGMSLGMAMQLVIPVYGPQPRPVPPPASQVNDLSALGAAASTTS